MQFPVTRPQLRGTIENFGFSMAVADRVIQDWEGSGRISLSGSMLSIDNPTDVDAPMIIGVAQLARGATNGAISAYRIKEYLTGLVRLASTRGKSSRG